jgi:hypothetical protein
MTALVIAALALLADHSAGQPFDAIREFRSWFKEYKKGGIDLYQKSTVPVANADGSELRYFKNDGIRHMDALLQALADRNNLEAAKLLTEAATFRFDRRGDVEVRKFYEKQPWILRSHAAEALTKITNEEALDWLRNHLLESRSLWDSAYRRSLGLRIFSKAGDSAADLLPALDDRDPDVREQALGTLARTGTIREIGEVYRMLGDESEATRVAAVEAIGGILTNDRNSHPSLFYQSLEHVQPLLDDPSWSVKDAVLSFMEKYRSVRTIPVLIDLLAKVEVESGQYRIRTLHRIVEVLQSLTGVTNPGVNSDGWKKWWESNKSTFILPPEAPMRLGYQTGTAQFFSIPLHSDRILFVLDISGSMQAPLFQKDPDVPGESKLDRARRELSRTLGDLHPDIRFNIFLFNDSITAFANDYKPASPVNITAAELFFKDAEAKGGTNLFDALNRALALQDIGTLNRIGAGSVCDTIFLLSDGVPSTGLVINPDEILEIISKANRRKRIRIHTIYVGAEHSPFMQEFAQRNFGAYVHVK